MKLCLAILILNLGDRTVTAFKDARTYAEQGEFIQNFVYEIEKKNVEGKLNILFVSEIVESEFLNSLPMFLKDRYPEILFDFKPYEPIDRPLKEYEKKLVQPVLNIFRGRIFEGDFKKLDLLFVRKKLFEKFKQDYPEWFQQNQPTIVENYEYYILF